MIDISSICKIYKLIQQEEQEEVRFVDAKE